jgi:membrane protein implicated in regulation of membrane protease activity
MSGWILWLAGACLFGIGELATTSFFLAPFAVGAGLAAVAAALGGGGVVAWAVFIVGALLTLAFVRPLALGALHRRPPLRTGAAALVGKDAIVLERICNHEAVGCVKIDGEVWTARAYDDSGEIERGARVHVMEIKGATAIVAE